MSSLYLRDDLDAADVAPGDVVELTGVEARHALIVNRARLGEQLAMGNARGLIVRGIVTGARDGVLSLTVETVKDSARPRPMLTLVQALAKGDRDELAIQAATELGVDRVIPWAAERSVSRWAGPKLAKGRERWRTIVREAAKQSVRAWVPEVGELAALSDIASLLPSSRVLVLEPTAELALTGLTIAEPTSTGLADDEPEGHGTGASDRDLVLVVGPEGGIAPSELSALTAAGADAVRLGGSVLRTSTAGPAALAAINVILHRW
jgi:16S rRNA (uracil1498-N3)-methyltransferase